MAAAAPRRVLVGTDLSDQAGLAVRRAARLAAPHVLHTGLDAELTEGPHRRVVLAVDTSPAAACVLTPHATQVVMHVGVVPGENLAAELTPPATQVVIESGCAQDTLPELIPRYVVDLVAVGTGSRTRLGYALLGCVAQHVLRDAASDVLVVPACKG